MGQIMNGKGERTYSLKVQSGYSGSDQEWYAKVIKDIHSENVEQV